MCKGYVESCGPSPHGDPRLGILWGILAIQPSLRQLPVTISLSSFCVVSSMLQHWLPMIPTPPAPLVGTIILCGSMIGTKDETATAKKEAVAT